MGTNYYLHVESKPACEHCGRGADEERLHIGKNSAGWCFSLHVIPERGINDLEDWINLFPSGVIRDEYGGEIGVPTMLERIWNRSWGIADKLSPHYSSWEDFHRRNQSEPGPNGLLRHQIGHNCIKHGEGTWDCIVGEFS